MFDPFEPKIDPVDPKIDPGMRNFIIRSRLLKTRKGTQLYWVIGPVALVAGAFLLAGFPGAIIAIGVTFVAMAAAQDIKMQLYPVGVWH